MGISTRLKSNTFFCNHIIAHFFEKKAQFNYAMTVISMHLGVRLTEASLVVMGGHAIAVGDL